jgi:hypothetical protein
MNEWMNDEWMDEWMSCLFHPYPVYPCYFFAWLTAMGSALPGRADCHQQRKTRSACA